MRATNTARSEKRASPFCFTGWLGLKKTHIQIVAARGSVTSPGGTITTDVQAAVAGGTKKIKSQSRCCGVDITLQTFVSGFLALHPSVVNWDPQHPLSTGNAPTPAVSCVVESESVSAIRTGGRHVVFNGEKLRRIAYTGERFGRIGQEDFWRRYYRGW